MMSAAIFVTSNVCLEEEPFTLMIRHSVWHAKPASLFLLHNDIDLSHYWRHGVLAERVQCLLDVGTSDPTMLLFIQ